MVVDEAHCSSHWGADFRKKYGTLGIVRAFLPRGTPVIAMTATLTARVRRDIQSKLHFPKGGSRFVNVGNSRCNISLVVRACQHPLNSFKDLDFILPTELSASTDIPKTWIYIDNINDGNLVIEHLRDVLKERCPLLAAKDDSSHLIRPFNAAMSLEYRREAMAAFREGKLRVMVCTDAAGMVRGCLLSILFISNPRSVAGM